MQDLPENHFAVSGASWVNIMTFLFCFLTGFGQDACREPISSVFRFVFDQNADGVVDDSELADVYEVEPCMRNFFKECAKAKETFTEAEFCSCFNDVGKQ